MKKITLRRGDFRETAETGSFFDGVLWDLDIPEDQHSDIEEIEIRVDGYVKYNYDGEVVCNRGDK